MDIQHFSKNTKGRDLVVGDLHGCFRILEQKLKEIDFDETKDRLFAVGDLVDRHPDSDEFWEWLNKPWFHSVLGNHELMTIDAFEYGPNSSESKMHYYNGGDWFYGIPTVEQQCYVEVMKEMPLGIEIETDNGLVGIIHAEVPWNDWDEFKRNLDNPTIDAHATWQRSIISYRQEVWVKGVCAVYCGHSFVEEPTVLGNMHFIDTGCVFNGKLTIVQVN